MKKVKFESKKIVRHKILAFTLIEVMIALAVIALSMAAAITSSTETGRRLGYLESKTYAHWVAENELDKILTGQRGMNLSNFSTQGYEEQADRKWLWQINAVPSGTGTLAVTVTVQSPDEKKPLESMTTYVHDYTQQ